MEDQAVYKTKSLTDLAIKYGTDKWGGHSYTPHYERHFAHLRNEPLNLLEIGVGGYHDPNKGGESLRMWKEWFPNAQIYSIDLHDKSTLQEERITIYQCSQVNREKLEEINKAAGGFDIIIDDGSHVNAHVIESFEILYPLLKPDGIYVVEDQQTSYWPTYGGGLWNKDSQVEYFKAKIDSLNHAEIQTMQPSFFALNTVSMTFYHNLLFIQKGDNTELSNTIKK